jgi:hypothetical protein
LVRLREERAALWFPSSDPRLLSRVVLASHNRVIA